MKESYKACVCPCGGPEKDPKCAWRHTCQPQSKEEDKHICKPEDCRVYGRGHLFQDGEVRVKYIECSTCGVINISMKIRGIQGEEVVQLYPRKLC